MITFDRVLPELLRICEEHEGSRAEASRYCVVRDVRGRVRLVLEPRQSQSPGGSSLEDALSAALGGYFVRPIISTDGGDEVRRLAKKLIETAAGAWPVGWPVKYIDVLGGEIEIEIGARWMGIERTIGKEAWLSDRAPAPPWPLVKDKTPPIVTIHSFKGGVARSTLVAAYAIHCASRRQRVAVVDLDLEAPGAGHLFSARTGRGVLDVLMDHIATGRIDLDGSQATAELGHAVDGFIKVFAAGTINDTYLQKLARLDFSSTSPGRENPVGTAIKEMLQAMKKDFDVIVLDSRAGLHDLAGMSLHGLAHVDVLVFRGTAQHFAGLEQTLRTLGSREPRPLVLVETFLPPNDNDLLARRREETARRVYDLLVEHLYPEEEPPQMSDLGSPHDVVAVRRKDWLDNLDSLAGLVDKVIADEDLEQFANRVDAQVGLGAGSGDDSENEEGIQ